MPLYPNSSPDWLRPENASVFDPWTMQAMRKVVNLLGLTDPQQVMGMGTAAEVPGEVGGLVGALAKRFPRTAAVIKAYHGSPHDFEQFDMSKIGTGEGAQAYGHGLYFAENPDVAAGYRKQLSGFLPSGWDAKYPESSRAYIRGMVGDVASGRETPDRAARMIYNANASMRSYPLDRLAGELSEAAELTKGKMYEVAIHADPEHFLDWDKPLSQQSEVVKRAIENVPHAREPIVMVDSRPFHEWADNSLPITRVKAASAIKASGGDIPKAIQSLRGLVSSPQSTQEFKDDMSQLIAFMDAFKDHIKIDKSGIDWRMSAAELSRGGKLGDPVAVSKALREAGIPGIKYFDQVSRGTGEGTRNYVVFNDKTIEILRKYGLALPVAQQTLQQQQPQSGVGVK